MASGWYDHHPDFTGTRWTLLENEMEHWNIKVKANVKHMSLEDYWMLAGAIWASMDRDLYLWFATVLRQEDLSNF